jgi:hypothetical protein
MSLIASKEVKKQRLDICNACDKFIAETSQCGECLCFMNIKAALSRSKCPIGKWYATG